MKTKRIYHGKSLNRNKPPKIMSYEQRLVYNAELALKVRTIGEVVANFNNVNLYAISEKTRKSGILLIRQIVHKICKELTAAPLWIIGEQIGGRDHSTVLHSIEVINNYFDTKNELVINIYNKSFEAAKHCIFNLPNSNPILDKTFIHNVEYCPQF